MDRVCKARQVEIGSRFRGSGSGLGEGRFAMLIIAMPR